ncbi:Crp/Fnr family transcriptional regulator [Streptomyces sp. CB02923]|uniref:family 2B encapsulin nanocompartment shell protein n=1 Tax=Streptomyces sp. CB02923 TaxID=1718985 RepID=UPI00093C27A7|nr:family 2B encapsulin nanocompartment shell protein [Streptomyces sp. CB02923]OKH98926.1 Crp/Fnr family transcriptional regulator [Streptomyces sp. CB02923]
MSTETGHTGSEGTSEQVAAQTALSTAAARNLATTTKTPPQMQGITSRWLLRVLPWAQVSGGTYRVNRRLSYTVGHGRVSFVQTGAEARLVPPSLGELPVLRGLDDQELLAELAGRFTQRDVEQGEVVVERGAAVDQVFVVAHGKLNRIGEGPFGDAELVLGVLADGDHFGDEALTETESTWPYAVKAATAATLLALPRQAFVSLRERSTALQEQVERYLADAAQPQNRKGEADIDLVAGHVGEPALPGTYVEYELRPREYELSVAQTVLKIHTRVADLYNQPMNQTEQQLRLTIEALRERQEHELVNNREFGLLHNADYDQRISTLTGPPTPDDLDELLSRRRRTKVLLAHPRAISAFFRECNRRGVYPSNAELNGRSVAAWRGVPLLPCNKIPVSDAGTSSVFAMRTGEEDQGVVGLHQTGIPDEYEPGLSVRFMGIDDKAVIRYLVSAYYSAAVLVPDALGVLENVEVARHD